VIDRARTSRARSISEATIRGLRPGDSSSTMDERVATVLAGTAPLFVLDVRARALTGARHTGAALRFFITSQAPESIEFAGGTPSTIQPSIGFIGFGDQGARSPDHRRGRAFRSMRGRGAKTHSMRSHREQPPSTTGPDCPERPRPSPPIGGLRAWNNDPRPPGQLQRFPQHPQHPQHPRPLGRSGLIKL
jgi:hypothetical protein